jgi:cytochrome c556
MKKKSLFLGLVLFLGLPSLSGRSEEPRRPEPLMQQKLKHAQKVLEGLAINDFDKIADNGNELLAISKLAEWKAVKTPRYATYSDEFQEAVEKLIKNAKDKNLDGATLAYLEMTSSCVKCHKHVREARMVPLNDE